SRPRLPLDFAAAQGDEFGSRYCPAVRHVASGMATRGTSSLASPRGDCLFSHRRCRPHARWPRDSGAYREVSFRKNTRLRALSESDSTNGGEGLGERVEASTCPDLGSPSSRVHY